MLLRLTQLPFVALCALSILVAGGLDAHSTGAPSPNEHDITFFGPDGSLQDGVRCATAEVSSEEAGKVREIVDRWLESGERARASSTKAITAQSSCSDYDEFGTAGCAAGDGIIPVAFHVIHNGRQGKVSDAQIRAQLDVLNAAYADAGYRFTLLTTTRTRNPFWFRLAYNPAIEIRMKKALAIDPAHVLNFYTTKPSGGILGWATFPWSYSEDREMQGVVVLYSTLPGGGASPYNEGDTGTHEVGHYLGLYHTFQNGCLTPGDEVDDTPYEAGPNYDCPVGADTCEGEGPDPITNFMDYTDDACMLEFTTGQMIRMNEMVGTFQPGL